MGRTTVEAIMVNFETTPTGILNLAALTSRAVTIGAVGKGSGGKSTILSCLAAAAAADGRTPLLLDADAQNRSLLDWHQLRAVAQQYVHDGLGDDARLVRIDVATLATDAETVVPMTIAPQGGEPVAPDYDVVLFDFAGAPTPERERWLGRCELVLMPTETTAPAIMAARRIHRHCRCLGARPIAILNRTRGEGRRQEARAQLSRWDIQTGPDIREYIAFADAFAHGYTMPEQRRTRPEGAADVADLWRWCQHMIDQRRSDPPAISNAEAA